jgi:hypothetical protein
MSRGPVEVADVDATPAGASAGPVTATTLMVPKRLIVPKRLPVSRPSAPELNEEME